MSESTVTFSYTAPNTYQKYAENIKQTMLHDLFVAPTGEYSYAVINSKHCHLFQCAEINESRVGHFLQSMGSYCLTERMLICNVENSAESVFFALISGQTCRFNSLEACEEAKKELDMQSL